MNEIKCPHCGTVFTINETEYSQLLAQVRGNEFEKEILMEEAAQLLKLCAGGVIDKTRYLVKSGKHTFEIDEFYGDNEGLVMAEVELESEEESYDCPDFIGREVTGDERFYNSHLLANPFKNWKDTFNK